MFKWLIIEKKKSKPEFDNEQYEILDFGIKKLIIKKGQFTFLKINGIRIFILGDLMNSEILDEKLINDCNFFLLKGHIVFIGYFLCFVWLRYLHC